MASEANSVFLHLVSVRLLRSFVCRIISCNAVLSAARFTWNGRTYSIQLTNAACGVVAAVHHYVHDALAHPCVLAD
jgi:hypothetical protein